jgi:hypothetical protein
MKGFTTSLTMMTGVADKVLIDQNMLIDND